MTNARDPPGRARLHICYIYFTDMHTSAINDIAEVIAIIAISDERETTYIILGIYAAGCYSIAAVYLYIPDLPMRPPFYF
jgi:hypothetical protein